MDYTRYQQYLKEYVSRAIEESDGSNRGIAEALSMIEVGGRFTPHKEERRRALEDARREFNEHRHWPREIILKQLGINSE